jgi:DNA modification methylase
MTAPITDSIHPPFMTEPLTLHCGHNAEILKQYPDSHFDAVVTDPPYGIEFLGKTWDSHTGAVETWQQCLRVLKPGGHLLAFSAARTYHHLATNIESVGFEIRDQLMWIYSSGFPKAQDIGKSIERRQGKRENANTGDKWENASGKNSTGVNTTTCRTCKRNNVTIGSQFHCENSLCDMRERLKPAQNQWAGWKTALKPGHEPIVMARRPFKGSTIDNVQQHGVGALNIDVSRIPYEDQADLNTYINNIAGPLERSTATAGEGIGMHEGRTGFKVQRGRVKRPKDNLEGMKRATGSNAETFKNFNPEQRNDKDKTKEMDHGLEEVVYEPNPQGRYPSNVMGDIPHYQKYFYCPKVSRKERHVGHETPPAMFGDVQGCYDENGERFAVGLDARTGNVGNNHPTVKPVALMRYLIQLVTPANSRVLDPFMGSGSTGMAARELGHTFVGIDLDPAYVSIAERRILGWCQTEITTLNKDHRVEPTTHADLFDDLFE